MATIAIHLEGGGKAIYSMEFKDALIKLGVWEDFVGESTIMDRNDYSKKGLEIQLLETFWFKNSKKGFDFWHDILLKLGKNV